MIEIFDVWNKHFYNLRQHYQLSHPLVKAVCHGTESLSHLGPKVLDALPKKLLKCKWSRRIQKGCWKNGNLRIVFLEFVRSSTLQMSVLYRKQLLNCLFGTY